MKRNLYLSLLMLLPVSLSAQLTIQNMDNYTIGQNFRYVNCTPTNVSPSTAGTGNHWSFTLNPTDTTYSSVVSPGATIYSSKFATANIAVVSSDGRFVFYNHTTGKSYLTGFVDTNITVESTYVNTSLSSSRPISYGDTLTDTFTSSFIQGGNTFTGGGHIRIIADAEGMLHLPDNAYMNVLRVKLEIIETDSNTSGPVPVMVTTDRIVYLWYNNNFNSALLVWDSTNVTSLSTISTKTVSYLVDETLSVPSITSKKGDFFASVNHTTLTLNGVYDAGKQYDVILYNLNGQKLHQTSFAGNQNKQTFNLQTELVPGMYMVMLRDNTGGQNVIKMVKE